MSIFNRSKNDKTESDKSSSEESKTVSTPSDSARISNLNRLFSKFRKYSGKEFIHKKSRATACRFWLVNVCKGNDLVSYRRPGWSLRRLKGRAELIWPVYSGVWLGLNGSRRVIRWWLRCDVIQDLLNYVWVSNIGDNAHGATTQRA